MDFYQGENSLQLFTFPWKEKQIALVSIYYYPNPAGFPWVTGTVDYGMDCKTSVMFRGGGTGCSALHGNQRKALSVELNLHSKSPYGADYHTWERER